MRIGNDLLLANDAAAFARERLDFHPDPMQQLVLGHEPRGLLNCSRQWGKSTVTAIKALHHALYRPGALVVVASPGGRQSGEFVRKCEEFLDVLGIRRRGDGKNRISIELPNGARIVGLPDGAARLRGFSAVSLMLIDEAAQVSTDMYRTLRPMLATSKGGGSLWLMSTPFGKRGFFWDEWSKGGERWKRVSVKATDCPRIAAEFLDEERATLGERWFRQEYLCEFVQTDDCFFNEEDILGCVRQSLPALFR